MIQNYEIVRSRKYTHPETVVIVLHGYGATGRDFASVGEFCLSGAVDDTVFVFPDAPHECDAGRGRQWFALHTMTHEELRIGLQNIGPGVYKFIQHISKEYACDKVVVAGFSQGAMLALEMGYFGGISGVIAYSGIFVEDTNRTYDTNTNVLIVHSDDDVVVPYQNATDSVRFLTEAGVSAMLVTCHNIGHTISSEGWNAGLEFMKTC
ncbi:MAG: prolyl oligopeptidase family serine peptidase [Holosporales bacterium]|jgi:phospholipase/carboxylesterase|nr:prolyl oligopeptidase family serine peptidase [Holosporales bacterium]